MNLYLTIITTALVLTQIIRLIQNAMQLRHLSKVHEYDDYIYNTYKKLNKALDVYLTVEGGNCEDCKHGESGIDKEPCKSCMNNHVSNFEMREDIK